jgi:hypothetical protein
MQQLRRSLLPHATASGFVFLKKVVVPFFSEQNHSTAAVTGASLGFISPRLLRALMILS